MNPKTIQILKERMASLETIPADVAFDMLKVLDKMPVDGLEIIVKEDIKFLAMPAVTRLVADHGYTLDQVCDLRYGKKGA